MIPETYKDLLCKLHGKTLKGQANWRPTAAANKFLINFKDFSLTIFCGTNPSEPDWVSLELLNEDGKGIDSFYIEETDPSDEDYQIMYSMHSAARRKALRIDEAISVINKELDTQETVGSDSGDDFIPNDEEDVPM